MARLLLLAPLILTLSLGASGCGLVTNTAAIETTTTAGSGGVALPESPAGPATPAEPADATGLNGSESTLAAEEVDEVPETVPVVQTTPPTPKPTTSTTTTTTIDVDSLSPFCRATKRFVDAGTVMFDGAPGLTSEQLGALITSVFSELENMRSSGGPELQEPAAVMQATSGQLEGLAAMDAAAARRRIKQYISDNQSDINVLLSAAILSCPEAGIFDEPGAPGSDSGWIPPEGTVEGQLG